MKISFNVGNGHLIGNIIAFFKNGVVVESCEYAQHSVDLVASNDYYLVTVPNTIDFDTIRFTGSNYTNLAVLFKVLNETSGVWVSPSGGNYIEPDSNGVSLSTAVFTLSSSAFTGLIPTYALTLTLVEQLTAIDFIARAYSVATGELVTEKTVQSGTITLSLPNARPVTVIILPKQGDGWKAGTYYAINELVFPMNPFATPYYYKRLAASMSSATTEPIWSTTVGSQCDDGDVANAWELVAMLAQPVVQSPLTLV